MTAQVVTGIFNAFAVYFLIWWITLFAVLPWGVRSQTEGSREKNNRRSNVDTVSDELNENGIDPGAPVFANMRKKLISTSLISLLFFVIYFVSVETLNIDKYDLLQIPQYLGIYIPEDVMEYYSGS